MNCPFCNLLIDPSAFFCPNCGKQVREKPVGTSFSEQIKLYLISIFLPPFGLGLTIRYLRSPDTGAKIAGIISLILTLVVLVFVVWSVFAITSSVQSQVNESMKMLKNFGY